MEFKPIFHFFGYFSFSFFWDTCGQEGKNGDRRLSLNESVSSIAFIVTILVVRMKRWGGLRVTVCERKKERRRSLSFGHKLARELLPAVRYPPFFFISSRRAEAKKHCGILAQQQFFLPRRIRSLQIEIGHYVSDPILPCFLCFCFGIEFFGRILRFLKAFFWGGQCGGRISAALCFVGNLRHFALVWFLVISVFRYR